MKYLVNMLIINFLMLTAAEVPAEEVPAEKSKCLARADVVGSHAAASVGLVDSASSFSGAAGRPMATTVEEVTTDLYCSKRKDGGDLAFGMARLTKETLDFWKSFVFEQYKASAEARFDLTPGKEPSGEKDALRKLFRMIDLENAGGIREGLCAFQESLRVFRDQKYMPEIWIVYALSGNEINPTKPITKEQFPNIEMVLTVFASSEFTAHMGICRTVYHEVAAFKGEVQSHKRLSIIIHQFAAIAMRMRHSSLRFMITSPVAQMARIINEALGPQAKTGSAMPQIFEKLRSLEECKWFYDHHHLLSKSGVTTHVIDIKALAGQFA